MAGPKEPPKDQGVRQRRDIGWWTTTMLRVRESFEAVRTWTAKWIGRPLSWLNAHAAILALLIGAPWAIYQFWFKEIFIPATRVGHATVDVGLHCLDARGPIVPVEVDIAVHNHGPGDADIFAAWYIVEGAKLRHGPLLDPEYRDEVKRALGQQIDVAQRYMSVVHRQPVCNGSVLNALGVLGPSQDAHARIVAFVPADSFEIVRAYVFVLAKRPNAPGLTHPWDVQGGGWVRIEGLVQWKGTPGNYEFAPVDDAVLKKAGFTQAVARTEVVLPAGVHSWNR